MRLVKRTILLFITCSALALAACGGGDDDGGNGAAVDASTDGAVDPNGQNHTYVVNDVIAPASTEEANRYGLTSMERPTRPESTTSSAACWGLSTRWPGSMSRRS